MLTFVPSLLHAAMLSFVQENGTSEICSEAEVARMAEKPSCEHCPGDILEREEEWQVNQLDLLDQRRSLAYMCSILP